MAVVQHAIGAQFLVADAEAYLVGHEGSGVAFVFYQIVNEVLAHPFFGCQCHVTMA